MNNIPTQATASDLLLDSIGRGTLLRNSMDEANLGTNAILPDQGLVITDLNQNRLSSDLSGLNAFANQIRNTHQHGVYPPATRSFGTHNMMQHNPTFLNMLQHGNSLDLPSRIASQATLEQPSQSINSNTQLSDYMNRLVSSNPNIASALGQLTMYPSHQISIAGLASRLSEIQQLEQLSQLSQQNTAHNALATLGSSTTPPLYNLHLNAERIMQNTSLHDRTRMMGTGITNSIRGQTNISVDALEALRRSVLSALPQTQNASTDHPSPI
jgi:hypothetical protein